jgi:DNA-binding GntR family transcriptional regulator
MMPAEDVAFHRALFAARGSTRLLRTFDEVSAELRLLIAQLRPTYASVADLAHEHELLLVALRSGDVRQARAAWSQHFDDSERFFLDLIKEHAQ